MAWRSERISRPWAFTENIATSVHNKGATKVTRKIIRCSGCSRDITTKKWRTITFRSLAVLSMPKRITTDTIAKLMLVTGPTKLILKIGTLLLKMTLHVSLKRSRCIRSRRSNWARNRNTWCNLRFKPGTKSAICRKPRNNCPICNNFPKWAAKVITGRQPWII